MKITSFPVYYKKEMFCSNSCLMAFLRRFRKKAQGLLDGLRKTI